LAAAEAVAEIEAAFDAILGWPRTSGYIDDSDGTLDMPPWIEMAARGLYAYDWDGYGRYTRRTSPTDPVGLHELPPEVRTAACFVRFAGSFAAIAKVHAPRATRAP
jgi:hypothetical protein